MGSGGIGGRGKNKLSDLAIKSWLKKPASRKLFDGDGLFLTLTAAQSPVWRVKYRVPGKESGRYFSIGPYPEVGLKEARLRCEAARAQLREGRDPVQERQKARIQGAAAAGDTFGEVMDAWLAKKKPGWSGPMFKTTSETLERYAKIFRPFRIAEITDPMVAHAVEHVVNEGIRGEGSIETAKKLRQSLGGIFRFGMARGLCTRNPADSVKELIPTRKLTGRRPAFVTWAELGDILRKVTAANISSAVRMAHRLCAFTAARPGNIIAAEWSEFTLEGDPPTWKIPRAKMKMQDRHHDHMVILGPTIAAELRIWRAVSDPGKYLFPSLTEPGEHITSESLSKLYRVTLGLKDKHTPHGWRASFSTLARDNGFDRDAVEMALDHIHANDVIRAYDRGERFPERVRLAQWWDAQLVKAEQGDR